MTKDPIILVEDNKEDWEIYGDSIKAIGVQNEIIFFDAGKKYLSE